jgi:DNA-binding FadR family transcriptional regulator
MQITDGTLRAGQRLPPFKALGAQYGVSEATVLRAIRPLSDEGWVETVQGVGTFVRKARRVSVLPEDLWSKGDPSEVFDTLLDVIHSLEAIVLRLKKDAENRTAKDR